MKKLLLIALTFSALAVSACTVVEKPGKGPPHCPPGHAKKGWC